MLVQGGNEAEKERRSVAKSASTTGGPALLDFAIVLGCVFLSPVCGVFLRCLTYRKRTQLNTALSQSFFLHIHVCPPPASPKHLFSLGGLQRGRCLLDCGILMPVFCGLSLQLGNVLAVDCDG